MIMLLPWPALGRGGVWPDLSQPPQAAGGGEKDAAVVVGVEKYASRDELPGARQNAQDWQSYFIGSLKIPSDRVAFLADSDASAARIRQAAAGAAAQAQSGGTLWFVFIGHGAPSQDGRGALLVGADVARSTGSLYAGGLARGELVSMLNRGRQARTVVLLDSDYSGLFSPVPVTAPAVRKSSAPFSSDSSSAAVAGLRVSSMTARPAPEFQDARTILLTAATSYQEAGFLPKDARSRPAFSYLALGALRGWAADSEGRVKAAALLDFSRRAIALDSGRPQTPQLMTGDPQAVLGMGREKAPNLARIARAGGPREGFQISGLPALPVAEEPAEYNPGPDRRIDTATLDSVALERYYATVAFEKKPGASAEDKEKEWRRLSRDFRNMGGNPELRAEDWRIFLKQRQAVQDAKRRRALARDDDWERLSPLLASGGVPAADKAQWARQFVRAYLEAPGVAPDMAALLEKHLSQGPSRDALDDTARSASNEVARNLVRLRRLRHSLVEWVKIPGGSFLMGSLLWRNTQPIHQVTVDSFRMAKTFVTNKQYQACVDAGICAATCVDSAKLRGDDQPAVGVAWNEADLFSEWVGGRLPTEAEWEYAARSAGTGKYPWGHKAATCERAVLDEGGRGCGRDATWPVCAKPKGNTRQGLCDMAGNAWEWTQDWYQSAYDDAPSDARAWGTPLSKTRVLRGGAWDFDAVGVASPFRTADEPDVCNSDIGFRPARSRGH